MEKIRQSIERACEAYARGEIDISGAARYAAVPVQRMMDELQRREINYTPAFDDFLDGFESLLQTFGGDEAARQVIADFRTPDRQAEDTDTQ